MCLLFCKPTFHLSHLMSCYAFVFLFMTISLQCLSQNKCCVRSFVRSYNVLVSVVYCVDNQQFGTIKFFLQLKDTFRNVL